MMRLNLDDRLSALAGIEGTITIHNGVMTLPDGSTCDLTGPSFSRCDACGYPNDKDGVCTREQCYNAD